MGLDTGFHVFLELPPELDAREVTARCEARGGGVQTLEPFCRGAALRQGLLFGFATPSPGDIRVGARVVVEVLESLGRKERGR